MNESAESPRNEVNQKVIRQLKYSFGDKAVISKDSETSTIWVISVLEDGIIRGGQKIELELEDDFEGKDTVEMPGSYLVRSMKVNGFEKIRNTDRMIINPYTTEEEREIEVVKKDFEERYPGREDVQSYVDFHLLMTFSEGETSGSGIVMRGLKNADHLGIFYHEKGHNSGDNITAAPYDGKKRTAFLKTLAERIDSGNEKMAEISWESIKGQIYLGDAKAYIDEEVRADINAISIIDAERNQSEDPFPEDEDNWQVKKLFEVGILTSLREDKPLLKALSSDLNRKLELLLGSEETT